MSTKTLPTALFTAAMTLACVAALAGAQAKPIGTAEKAGASSAPAAASAAACARPDGNGEAVDAHGAMKPPGMMRGHGMMDAGECKVGIAASIADIKVENTKRGATVQLVAKSDADVTKVQELARDFAQCAASHEARPIHPPSHRH